MAKRMLVDATHPEETRVVVVNGNKLDELDFEIASRRQLKGNIYLAKVIRVEPSLQAAFVEYGGNRHGFLAFSEIHPDYYRIPVADREALMREYERERSREEREDEAESAGQGNGHGDYADSDADEGAEGDSPLSAGDGGQEGGYEGGDAAPEAVDAGPEGAGPLEAPGEEGPAEGAEGSGAEGSGAEGSGAEGEGAEGGARPRRGRRGGSRRRGGGGGSSDRQLASSEGVVETLEEEEAEDQGRRRPRSLRSYKIQEVIRRRQILLVQVTKEERGTKGAALTTYLSLPGRYCVLMPNTPRGGGISRKITNPQDRKRLKELLEDLDIPHGMAVILRTAGMERTKQEIKRDLEYLMRLWDSIREQTMQSVAPALIYEEANLIKRSIRDLYSGDLDEVWVEGEAGYRTAKDFMRMLMPSHAKKVQPYRDDIPLFHRYQVEGQIETMFNPVVQLRSGGYIVINQTEALVAIDVNSGRATKERNIEETALRTNLEAAEEVARQLRLRDLAGLIVIDFIDMEDARNNAAVEKRLKESMKADRARIQLGRISGFGLLELSRQRLRPSLQEINFERCPHCAGSGMVRSIESAALCVLRAIEEEGIRRRSSEITVTAATQVTLYILNQKRDALAEIERRYGFRVFLHADDSLTPPDHRLERIKARSADEPLPAPVNAERVFAETDRLLELEAEEADEEAEDAAEETAAQPAGERQENGDRDGRRRRRRRRRRNGDERGHEHRGAELSEAAVDAVAAAEEGDEGEGEDEAEGDEAHADTDADGENGRKKRRRGKRGGRRRARNRMEGAEGEAGTDGDDAQGEDAQGEGAQGDGAQGDGAQEGAGQDDRTDAVAVPEAVPAEAAPAVADAAVAEAASIVAAVTGATAEPALAEEAPAPKKRASRSRKKAAEAPAEAASTVAEPAPAAEPAAAEPAAEEAPAPKKRATRSRKKAAEPAAAAETTVTEAVPAAEAPPAEAAAPEAPAPEATAPEATGEPVPAEAAPEENAAAAGAVVVNPPVEKPKKGWWSKLIKS
ncbi:MAG TPA: ribonuclease E/G [Azospirillaceae bacterium]|nr:ribonuclease E/G [Azospirillaceae bacterium]